LLPAGWLGAVVVVDSPEEVVVVVVVVVDPDFCPPGVELPRVGVVKSLSDEPDPPANRPNPAIAPPPSSTAADKPAAAPPFASTVRRSSSCWSIRRV
jgi:hypothetical protein